MTDTDRVYYKNYLRKMTDRELFMEREAVKNQGELADPGTILAIAQEFEYRAELAR
jgi:hypothetical protein